MITLFVIGNGKSRLEFDLNKLKGNGNIIGCNWLFKDFDGCDGIVALDEKPKAEVPKELLITVDIYEFEERKIIYKDEEVGQMPNHLIKGGADWDAGRTGLIAGLEIYKPERVFLIGFDFMDLREPGLEAIHRTGNNVYHNVFTERPEGTERIYNYCVEQNPEVEFIRVGKLGDPILDLLKYKMIDYPEFEEILNE